MPIDALRKPAMAETAVPAFFLFIYTIASSLGGIHGSMLSKQDSMVFNYSFTNKFGRAAVASAYQSDGAAAYTDGSSSTRSSLRLYNPDSYKLNRLSFPNDFLFGTASAAYQFEGACAEGGRGPSIWDTYTQKHPERIKDGSSGAVAVDSYHRYKEDVSIMKEIGFNAYRFSISWSRLLPRGHFEGEVNQEGIRYYNNLIDEIISKGLQPFVTLFHWDLPQSLEDEYGGFLSPRIVKDFTSFVEVCYKEFGDRVKHWITLNEPYVYAVDGYGNGAKAPGRCSRWLPYNCSDGDSSTEPYMAAHHLLLSHASAVKLYKDKYQMTQKGQIGITLNCRWMLPLSQSKEDSETAYRALAFRIGWFLEPLNFGRYPGDMVAIVGERLPKFSSRQSRMLKGSYDFIGLNYYTARYATNETCKREKQTVMDDPCASLSTQRNGVSIGPQAASDWLYIYPRGIHELLLYVKNKYQNPVIYITENGVDDVNDGRISLDDELRISFYNQHLLCTLDAIQDGVNIKGYFAWSLLDNFEWQDGYTKRFGIVFVDYKENLKRYPKSSAKWFQEFLLYKPSVEFL